MSLRLLLTYLLASFVVLLHAQPRPSFIQLEGSAVFGDINPVLKDSKGFLWFGCNEGLVRFNGTDYQLFRNEATGNNITPDKISALFEDERGIIWIGSKDMGLFFYRYNTDKIEKFPANFSNGNYHVSGITSLNGRLFVVCNNESCFYADTMTEQLVPVEIASKQQVSFHGIADCVADPVSKDRIWLFTSDGLYSYTSSRQLKQWHNYAYSVDELGRPVKAMAVTAAQVVYTAVKDKGLIEVNTVTGEVKNYQYSTGSSRAYHNNNIDGISVYNQKYLLVATKEEGVCFFDTDDKLFQKMTSENFPGTELNKVQANAIYRDDASVVFTTQAHGIWGTDLQAEKMIRVWPLQSVFNRVPGMLYARSLYVSPRRHKIFIGSFFGDGLYVIDQRTGETETYPFANNKSSTSTILINHIYEDHNGVLWVASQENGPMIFDMEQRRLVPARDVYPSLKNFEGSKVYCFYEDKLHQLYICTGDTGLARMSPDRKNLLWYRHHENDSTSILTNKLFAERLFEDHTGQLWISTLKGLTILDAGSGRFHHFQSTVGRYNTIDPAFFYSVAQDKQNRVYIGTNRGVYITQTNARTLSGAVLLQEKDGLIHRTVFSMQSDQSGRIWITCRKGLSCYIPVKSSFINFDQHNGIPSKTLMPPLYIDENDVLYHGSVEKVFSFRIGEMLSQVSQQNTWFTGFRVFNRDTLSGLALNNIKEIRLNYRQHSISFSFTAPSVSFPGATRYRYKLESVDPQWVDAGKRNYVSYANLKPGRYIFVVNASNASGSWSNLTRSIIIDISSPFWMKAWFWAACLLILLTAIYWLYRRNQQNKHAQQLLNEFATSLYAYNNIEDIARAIGGFCISKLGFSDCVVYEKDKSGNVLIQKAAAGDKSPDGRIILNPIEVPIGKGIVGNVALTGKAAIVPDTRKDKRYIVDDQVRLSEITVPILIEGRVYGVIDSENARKNFYTKYHLRILNKVADICAARIIRFSTEEALRGKISRDLHDDIGSALTTINVLSKVALNRSGDEMAMMSYLQRINESTKQTMESMSDIVWAINPANDKMETVMSKMRELGTELCENSGIRFQFHYEPGIEPVSLDAAQRKNIFLLYKEAVNNAVKYSGARNVTIQVSLIDKSRLNIEIKDDGKGFDIDHIKRGNGLSNMQERSRQLQGTCSIVSEPGKGTSIKLEMPIPFFGG